MPTQPPLDSQSLLGISRDGLPRHVAIIMDGNGRWARQRGLPRIEGHRNSSVAVRETVTQCARLGIRCLTLYSFSLENWKRPHDEVAGLMALYAHYLEQERATIVENDIRCIQIGRREGLPPEVLSELDKTLAVSRDNQGMTLCLALNYGSRPEIVDAVRSHSAASFRRIKSPSNPSPTRFTRPACPIPTCSSARRAKCESVISCSGRSATRSCS
jgi:undecaprenyl diphosphate synthase